MQRRTRVDDVTGAGATVGRLAAVAGGAAEQARGVATRVAGQHDIAWCSSAADGYRQRLAQLSVQVRAAAAEVDTVAADLQRLAARLP